MYGQTLIEFVQGPGEVIFLPHGLTHAVLNVHDNVAYTENFFYVSALPGMFEIAQLLIRTRHSKMYSLFWVLDSDFYLYSFFRTNKSSCSR